MKRRGVTAVLLLFAGRGGDRSPFGVLLVQFLMQPLLAQASDHLPSLACDPTPPRTQRRDVGEVVGRPDARMRPPFPSFEPYPFGPGDMNERAVDRAVAAFEVVLSLLFGQLFSGVEREA